MGSLDLPYGFEKWYTAKLQIFCYDGPIIYLEMPVWAVSEESAQFIFSDRIIRDCENNGWRFSDWHPNGTEYIGPIIVIVPEEIQQCIMKNNL